MPNRYKCIENTSKGVTIKRTDNFAFLMNYRLLLISVCTNLYYEYEFE